MKIKLFTLIGFLSLVFALSISAYQPAQASKTLAEMTISNFTAGQRERFTVTNEGLMIGDGAVTAVYTSPEIQADIPFNAIVPNWIANQEINFRLRTRPQNGNWTEWQIIAANPDWSDPQETQTFGEMIFTPDADQLHTIIQYTVSLSQQAGAPPATLQEVGFTLIDSSGGPTTAEMLAQQEALDAQKGIQSTDSNNPRPSVISRGIWCTDPACDYTTGIEYAPATHLIVHHTVSQNYGPDYNWAAVMRAIWNYHANSRGWGDIGYNYLIDINGVIYEGRLNEDYENLDVVGTHASGANTGSMAVSLIGNFIAGDGGIAPSQPMLDSLTDIMAWKAEQRNINVYDAGNTLPNINWGLPFLMGHRDVYGTTECPGQQTYLLLPWLRDQVAAKLNYSDPYLYVDELSAQFSKSNNSWREPTYNCGNNLHAYYTWSTDNAANSTNWGEWQLDVPENGRYSIEAYIPYCRTGRAETDGATYTINHANGSSQVTLSQDHNVGLWMTLGEFDLTAEGDFSVQLSDLSSTDSGLGVWFDALRLVRVDDMQEPPQTISNSLPTDGTLSNNPDLNFAWTISNTYPVLSTTLQISANDTFSPTLYEESWNTAVLTASQTITEDGSYYWRAQALLDQGSGISETISSPATTFILDTAVPTATIINIYQIPNNGYPLIWTGSDATSGIANYTLFYRSQGTTDWTAWLSDTTTTNGLFTPPSPAETYEFNIQATDNAGNQQPLPATAVIDTDQAILLPHAIMLPIVIR